MWLLLVMLACKGDKALDVEPDVGAAKAPPAAEAVEKRARSAATKLHMGEHLLRVDKARDAYISGDLEGAKAHLAWLAEDHLFEGLPEGSEPFLQGMRQAAGKGAKAESPAEVGVALGEVGASCASCHLANKTGPVLDFGSAPEGKEGVPSHMARHQYGVVAMWAGVVSGDDDDAWRRGTEMLGDMHELEARDFGLDELSDDARQRAANVHELAAAAATAKEPAARAEAYGAVLMGCHGCHAELKAGKPDVEEAGAPSGEAEAPE